MRTSILSRSVVAVATLAIGSVALASVPANAATPSGITRAQVLAAVEGVRAADAADEGYSDATEDILLSMVAAQCGYAPADIASAYGTPVAAGQQADGLLVGGYSFTGGTFKGCEFGAVAVADGSFALAGTATITGQIITPPSSAVTETRTISAALSGDVAVTAPINSTFESYSNVTTFTTSGNATKTTTSTTTTKVKDKKTSAEKKAAKKKYDSRLKSAKKSYTKALKKAGSSKVRKAAAKKSYAKKKASAKARYKTAISSYKLVPSKVTSVENRPFSLSVTDD